MRQFISEQEPDKDGILKITGKDFRYLRQVLRIKSGDMIQVRIPGGKLVNTTACRIDEGKRNITLQICAPCGKNSQLGADNQQNPKNPHNPDNLKNPHGVDAVSVQNENESSLGTEYFLIQFVPKPSKMEQIARQAAECGIKYIIPVAGEYSQSSSVKAFESKGTKSERISKIIREARQQSGSPVESEVTEILSLEKAVEFWNEKSKAESAAENERIAIALWERNEKTIGFPELYEEIAKKKKKIKYAAIAVGSEGGISPSEIELLKSAGFKTVHIQGNILRCETAAVYGIASLKTSLHTAEKTNGEVSEL